MVLLVLGMKNQGSHGGEREREWVDGYRGSPEREGGGEGVSEW